MTLVSEMWPLLSTMRLLGWLPARRRHDSGTLHVRPAWLVYCAFGLAVQLVPAAYLVYRGLILAPTLPHDLLLVSYMQLFAISMLQLTPLLAAIQARSNVHFLNYINTFQKNIRKLSKRKVLKKTGLEIWSRIAIVAIITPILGIMVVKPMIVGPSLSLKLDLYLSLSSSNVSVMSAWWVLTQRAVHLTSGLLLGKYQSLLANARPCDSTALSSRPLWLQLRSLVLLSGEALALAAGCVVLTMFTCCTYLAYELLGVESLGTIVFLTCWNLICMVVIFQACYFARETSENVYRDTLEAIKTTKLLQLSDQSKRQMLRFLSHLGARSPEVSLHGYVTVGRGLMTTLVGALVVNLVVLQQFNIPSKRLDIQDIFRFGGADL